MIKKILGVVILCLASLSSIAQAPPSVPSQMELAGVRLKITESAKREIEKTIDLLTRSQYHFQLKADRSNLYMHFVEKVLKEEGIPQDFKYLAIQEGEFISDAVSTSNAVGFWQFKKASAQELGLRVDNLVDERKHIIASTVGATKYLKRSNFVFDNWVLSLQSYLQGLTGTQRSVSEKLYGSKSMTITAKSHWYILKFLAHKISFQDFVGNGREHPEVELSEFKARGKTLRQVSQELGVDYDELKRLNKWLAQSRIPDEKDYHVIYPVKNGQRIAQNTSNKKDSSKPESKKTTVKTSNRNNKSNSSSRASRSTVTRPIDENVGVYPVIKGNRNREYEAGQIKLNGISAVRARPSETISQLAQRVGLGTDRLRQYNDLNSRSKIRGGNYYYLKKKKNNGKVHYHVVRKGETLWDISQKYGIKLKKLLAKNRMREVESLKVGRVLWLRFIRPSKVPVEYSNVLVSKPESVAENRLIREVEPPRASTVVKTQQLPESGNETESIPRLIKKELIATESDTIIAHKVKPKESFFGLSRDYGIEIDDILAWNELNIMDGLTIGQEINLVVKKAIFEAKAIETESLIHEVRAGENHVGDF